MRYDINICKKCESQVYLIDVLRKDVIMFYCICCKKALFLDEAKRIQVYSKKNQLKKHSR